jgi:hypothetical protein
MKVRQVIVIGALVIASLTAVGYATVRLVNARRSYAEQGLLRRAGDELARLGLTRTCGRGTKCACPAVPSAVFVSCRIVAGRVALSLPSVDACFTQWMAVDTVWTNTPSPMYFGTTWVSRYPQSIAPGWSLLAVAPCVD